MTYTDRHILLLKTAKSNFSSCDSSVTQDQLLHPLDNMAFLPGLSMTLPFPQQRRIYEYLLEIFVISYFAISFIVLHYNLNCNTKLGLSLVHFPHCNMCKTEPTNSLQNLGEVSNCRLASETSSYFYFYCKTPADFLN